MMQDSIAAEMGQLAEKREKVARVMPRKK